MDVCFSLQGSCTLADNLVFRIITFYFFSDMKKPQMWFATGQRETGMNISHMEWGSGTQWEGEDSASPEGAGGAQPRKALEPLLVPKKEGEEFL